MQIVNLLIDRGSDINTVTNDENYPFHLAVAAGHTEVARILIERGSNIECPGWMGLSPLHLAVQRGNLEMVNFLIDRGSDINAATITRACSPLHLAIERGHIEKVRVLLESGSDIECRDSLLLTPLHYANSFRHIEIFALLVTKCADVNKIPQQFKSSILGFAAQTNKLEVMEVLLAHGFNPDSHGEFGYTLLHRAAKYGEPKLEVVELLVRNGANIMAVDRDGYTPLHLAAMEGNSEILTLLLKRDADPLAFSKAWFAWNRKTPLHLALEGNHQECVELIKQHIIGESFETFLIVHRRNFGADFLALLFSPGTNVNLSNSDGDSHLHTAVRFGNLEVVEILDKLGADFTIKKYDGEIPLNIARDRNNESERMLRFVEERTFSIKEPAVPSLKCAI